MIQKKKFILFFNINFSIVKVRNKGEIMTKEDLKKYKVFLESLSHLDKTRRDLYSRDLALGKIQGPMTGYPSIDKPWLKEYRIKDIKCEIKPENTYESLKRYNINRLDNVALEYIFTSITYEEMFKNIEKAADSLTAMGIKKGDSITSILPNMPESVYIIYAAAKIGAVIDLIDPLTNAELLAKYCNNCNSKLFFTLNTEHKDSAIANLSRCGYSHIITVSPTESLSAPDEKEADNYNNDTIISWSTFINNGINTHSETVSYEKNMPFAILHTSGTSGLPKGAVISQDNINSFASQIINSPLKMKSGEKFLGLMPPFASYGLANGIHAHLCAGMRIRQIPSYEPPKISEQIKEYNPDEIAFTPAHVKFLLDSPDMQNEDKSKIRMMIAGDGLDIKAERAANKKLINKLIKTYGLTESTAGLCTCVRNKSNKLLSVGVPLAKTVISVFDESDSDTELGYDQKGEIAIYSPDNMLGYLNMPEETGKTLKMHSDGKVWLHTGDRGRIDRKGRVFIEGRLKRLIIQNSGLKSNPFEAEAALIKHELVKKVVVVGVKDKEHEQGQLPVAFIEINPKNMIKKDEIKKELMRICDKEVTYYSIPMDYVFVEQIPLTSRGKTDYLSLSKWYDDGMKEREIIRQRQLKIG